MTIEVKGPVGLAAKLIIWRRNNTPEAKAAREKRERETAQLQEERDAIHARKIAEAKKGLRATVLSVAESGGREITVYIMSDPPYIEDYTLDLATHRPTFKSCQVLNDFVEYLEAQELRVSLEVFEGADAWEVTHNRNVQHRIIVSW